MSNIYVTSILPSSSYNSLLIDHDAPQLAEVLQLRDKYVPALIEILIKYELAELLEPHLLHRHFDPREGEALVHKSLHISDSEDTGVSVDIAKAIDCPDSSKRCLVPLLWMASSSGKLVAYECGILSPNISHGRKVAIISANVWNSFSQALASYGYTAGIEESVSLRDKECIEGGEYVAPDQRSLLQVPTRLINCQPNSKMLESGWTYNKHQDSDAILPECTGGHVTQTKITPAGTVGVIHKITQDSPDAFNPDEVAPKYTDEMWNAVNSESFWTLGGLVEVGA